MVVDFIHKNFEENEYLVSVMKSLLLWKDISQFIHITSVIGRDFSKCKEMEQRERYITLIDKFEQNLLKLYHYGYKSFLTNTVLGYQDNFYFHVLRYYIPVIVYDTWDKYQLGVGIFSMKGFERRNRESKTTLLQFTNGKGNILTHIIEQLWDKFYFENSKQVINIK